ncbi:MAG: class I SAM-dependent methyltransferase [Bacteroidales bacterium]|nr:class I SAM-dependent methyltransferase [Bacteroidales bacterium]
MNTKCSCCSSIEKSTENDLTSYWNKTYNREIQKLGWYEENPEISLKLIEKCKLNKDVSILNVGAGASTLIDELVQLDYKNIIANDLSTNALDKLKERLGKESSKVKWIVDDLTKPTELNHVGKIDLWHDRAVLHFFNEPEEQNHYFELVKKLVKKTGYVIIAAFNLNGAEKCSGLYVFRYNKEMIQKRLGSDFELIEAFDHTYTMPSGDTREYIYTLFQRKS